MKLSEFKDRLLVAMLHHQRQIGFGKYFEPKKVAEESGLIFEAGQIRLCAYAFRDHGLIREAFTMGSGDDGGLSCMLTASGVEEAEELEDQIITQLPDDISELPASDRIVHLDHNSGAYEKAISALDSLYNSVEEDRSNNFEDKEQRLAEISASRTLLRSDRVNIKTILTIAGSVLGYLALKFVDAPIGELAQAAWSAVKALIGL